MVKLDWNPDRTKLKQFGFISLFGFGIIGLVLGLKFGWISEGKWLVPGILWGIGVVSALFSLIEPRLLKPLYLVLTAISAVIGPIVATVIMGLIFLIIFVPLGLFFRLTGRDELRLKVLSDARTYWEPKPEAQPAERYFRQH